MLIYVYLFYLILDPYSVQEQQEFAKCDHECPDVKHSQGSTNPSIKSFCDRCSLQCGKILIIMFMIFTNTFISTNFFLMYNSGISIY